MKLTRIETLELKGYLIEIDNYKLLVNCILSNRYHKNYVHEAHSIYDLYKLKELVDGINGILISNYKQCLALPFITEFTNFKGWILATEPTRHLASKYMEENAKMFYNKKEVNLDHYSFSNTWNLTFMPFAKMYSWQDAKVASSKITALSYQQKVSFYDEIVITPYSSGHSLGACNWLIEFKELKLAFISSSSLVTSDTNLKSMLHASPLDQEIFKQSNQVIFTDIIEHKSKVDVNLNHIVEETIHAIKNGRKVIIPGYINGHTFDVLEALSKYIYNNSRQLNWLAKESILVVSPTAESNLHYINIVGEWMNSEHQESFIKAEVPMKIGELIKVDKLKYFNDVQSKKYFNQLQHNGNIIVCSEPSLTNDTTINVLNNTIYNKDMLIILIDNLYDNNYIINHVNSMFKDNNVKCLELPIEIRLCYDEIIQLCNQFKFKPIINIKHQISINSILKDKDKNKLNKIGFEYIQPNEPYLIEEPKSNFVNAFMKGDLINSVVIHPIDKYKVAYINANLKNKNNVMCLEPINKFPINEGKHDYLPFVGFKLIDANILSCHFNQMGLSNELIDNQIDEDGKDYSLIKITMFEVEVHIDIDNIIIISKNIHHVETIGLAITSFYKNQIQPVVFRIDKKGLPSDLFPKDNYEELRKGSLPNFKKSGDIRKHSYTSNDELTRKQARYDNRK